MRLAWQPAFQSGSLERYSSLMDGCALRLCETLREAAAEGRAVDIWRALVSDQLTCRLQPFVTNQPPCPRKE